MRHNNWYARETLRQRRDILGISMESALVDIRHAPRVLQDHEPVPLRRSHHRRHAGIPRVVGDLQLEPSKTPRHTARHFSFHRAGAEQGI